MKTARNCYQVIFFSVPQVYTRETTAIAVCYCFLFFCFCPLLLRTLGYHIHFFNCTCNETVQMPSSEPGGQLIGTEYLRAKLLHTVYEGVPGGHLLILSRF